jgi:hypothetical protein
MSSQPLRNSVKNSSAQAHMSALLLQLHTALQLPQQAQAAAARAERQLHALQALLVTANLVTAANGCGESPSIEQQQPFDKAVQLLTAELTAQQKASTDAQVLLR